MKPAGDGLWVQQKSPGRRLAGPTFVIGSAVFLLLTTAACVQAVGFGSAL
jgi:hypothetical protein